MSSSDDDDDVDVDIGTVCHTTVYGTVEALEAVLEKGANPNLPWYTFFPGTGIPEDDPRHDPEGYNLVQEDTAVSLCFWEALGDCDAKIRLLTAHPTTDPLLAMRSIARNRDEYWDGDQLTYVENWARAKGVDVDAVYKEYDDDTDDD